MHKLGRPDGERDDPHVHPDVWEEQKTTGPLRIVAAPSRDPLGLMLELSRCLQGRFYLLYVLFARAPMDREPGRYQSPGPLDRPEMERFFRDFRDFLEIDGRHHLWILSEAAAGTIVYDHHNLLYAYGPLEGYEQVLKRRGLQPGEVSIPGPHSHHFHPAYDAALDRLLARFAWKHSPLRPGDED